MSKIGFSLVAGFLGPPLMVAHAIEGEEGMSKLYRFDVEVSTMVPGPIFERYVLGQKAMLACRVADSVRMIHGIIAGVRKHDEHDAEHGVERFSLRLVPKAWLLRKRKNTRIFQDKPIKKILEDVAEAVGAELHFELEHELPDRAYTTQYEESDWAFFRRLCAENGLLFYFEQPETAIAAPLFAALDAPTALAAFGGQLAEMIGSAANRPSGGEKIIITDHAAYKPIPPARLEDVVESGLETVLYRILGSSEETPAGPTVKYRSTGSLVGNEESINSFVVSRRVRSSKAVYREYDPSRPLTALEAEKSVIPARRAQDPLGVLLAAAPNPSEVIETLDHMLEDDRLELYHHEGRDLEPNWEYGEKEPERALHQARRDKETSRAKSNVARLEPGHTFKLEEYPVEILNSGWVVTQIVHRGSSSFADTHSDAAYENDFTCVPKDVPFLPARAKRRVVQACLTATVAGPEGEEIHTDEHGRIKVKFHWDRREEDHEPTCWIRVMNSWGGAGWGTQFIPRVGMEAIVAFENGDPDKPLVLGTTYNRVLPHPFRLPEEKTRSGWRTRSYPRSTGYNELSFQDRVDSEQIFMRAERDLDVEVRHDRTARVENDDAETVGRHQRVNVHGNQNQHIDHCRVVHVGQDDRLRVDGGQHVNVRGGLHEHVGSRSTHASGNTYSHASGMAELIGQRLVSVTGGMASLEGMSDASISSFGKTQVIGNEVSVDGESEILLACGGSFIRMTNDTIQLYADKIQMNAPDAQVVMESGKVRVATKEKFQVVSEDAVVLKASGANLGLKSEAKIDGSRVLLNSPTEASDTIDLTRPGRSDITVRDQDGNPIANARVLLTDADGRSVMAITNSDGVASGEVSGSATVTVRGMAGTEEG